MTTGNSPPPPPNAKPKTKQKGNILTSILSLSTVPYSSYVPEPKTFLHNASAEVKQLWIIAILILISRGSTSLRLIITGIIALATIIALPPRIWKPQLIRLAGITGLIFVFTAIGSDGVPPVLVNRSLPPITSETTASVLAASDAFKSSAIQSIGSILPQSMNEVAPKAYRYVMFHLGPITITKRSVALATALATVTFAALQSASLCLVTTPPERMAAAVGKALKPFGWVGVPVKELVLTVLLSLRFMAMVCWTIKKYFTALFQNLILIIIRIRALWILIFIGQIQMCMQ